MEVLLSIIQGNASSANSCTAESGLALRFLADLSAGSERAKVRQGEARRCDWRKVFDASIDDACH